MEAEGPEGGNRMETERMMPSRPTSELDESQFATVFAQLALIPRRHLSSNVRYRSPTLPSFVSGVPSKSLWMVLCAAPFVALLAWFPLIGRHHNWLGG